MKTDLEKELEMLRAKIALLEHRVAALENKSYCNYPIYNYQNVSTSGSSLKSKIPFQFGDFPE